MFVERLLMMGSVVTALCLALANPRASGGQIIGQLTDPENPATEAALDIEAAQIEQTGGRLTFRIDTRGPIPTTFTDPEDTITYLWLVDTDQDPNTGQPHGLIGSEFNVRAVIGQVYGGGFVDVTGSVPGGGTGTVAVNGNRVEITIWLPQIGTPNDFLWRCDSFHIANGQWVSGNFETAVAYADPLPYTPAARVTVTTPLLMLCPTGPATGMLEVIIRDASGNLLPTGDYSLTFQSTNPGVASVDATGLVAAHAVPQSFHDTPYVNVSADGVTADNAAVVRVTATDLGVFHSVFSGTHVAFYLCPVIEGVDLLALTAVYQVVEATDLAYAAEAAGVGTSPFNGGLTYFVLDVADDPATVPCGASGNPIRLGWLFGDPTHNSCYIVNDPPDRTPQWSVIFHEMGHNFLGGSYGFSQFCSCPSPAHNIAYSEGSASLAGHSARHSLLECPHDLQDLALQDLEHHMQNQITYFRERLASYQSSGANYATLDADILDGILCEMCDQYGPKVWFDYFSTFLPPAQPLPYAMDSLEQQATWFVAAMSASTEHDLRVTFANLYGFPIDDVAWPTFLAAVQARIAARPWPAPVPGDLNCDGEVDFDDINPFVTALVSQAGYRARYPECRYLNADCSRDGYVDFDDINPFVRCLVNGGCP